VWRGLDYAERPPPQWEERVPDAVAEQPGPDLSAFSVILTGAPRYEALRAFRHRARRGRERAGGGTA